MPEYKKGNPETIQEMFGSIAEQYDKTNAVLSFNLHKYWNKCLVDTVIKGCEPFSDIADLCCGTGEIALTYLKQNPPECSVYFIDFCKEMLACARDKAQHDAFKKYKLTYMQTDVQEIPLYDASIDYATMAYGIRNVKDPAQCLREVHRILKPGGRIGILELTQPENPFLRLGHKMYLKGVLPLIGKAITSNREAYQYLCNSIQGFIKPREIEKILLEIGYDSPCITPLTGGIATIISARK